LTKEYELHTNQISQWKKALLEQSPSLFVGKSDAKNVDIEVLTNPLSQQIDQLKVEVAFSKKNIPVRGAARVEGKS